MSGIVRLSLPIRYWLPVILVIHTAILTIFFVFLAPHDSMTSWRVQLQSGGAIALLIIAIFLLGHVLIKRRVARLLMVIECLSQGALASRIGLAGSDEFATIGAALDEMANRLEAAFSHQQQVADDLRRRNDLLQSLLAKTDIFIWSRDAESKAYLYVSPAAEQIYGYSTAALMANPSLCVAAICPDAQKCVCAAQQRGPEADYFQTEYQIQRVDGAVRWLHSRVFLIRDETGTPCRLDGISVDVTDIKKNQEALRIREERLRLALEGAQDGVWDWNVATGEVIFSQQWAAMLGYDLSDIEPHVKTWEKLVHPDDLAHVMQILNAHLAGGTPTYNCEHRLLTKTGEWKWILDRGQVVARDEYGQPLRAAGTHKDITERKQAELLLENFFRLSLDLLCIAGTDGYFKTVNPTFTKILGYSTDELLTTPFLAFVHPEEVEQTLAQLSKLAAGLDVIDFENRYRCKAGAYHWLSWRATVANNGLIYAVARDITPQRRLNIVMEQTNAAAHVGGWELDFLTDELYWTAETYRIHDTSPADYTPTIATATAFFTPEYLFAITAAIQQGRQSGTPWDLELELITAQQRRVWVHVIGKIQWENGQPVRAYGSCQDITERKVTENALRQSEARNRAILSVLPDLVFVCDTEGVLLDAHSAKEEAYYVTPEKFLGKRIDAVLPPPVGMQIAQNIRQAATAKRSVLEYSLLIQNELRHFEARCISLDLHRVLGIVRDITERKQIEEERFVRKIAEALPHMMYVYDLLEERHVYVNRQVTCDLGYTPEEFLHLGPTFVTILHADDARHFPQLRSRWDEVCDGEILSNEYQMKHANGEWRWFLSRDTVFTRTATGAVHQIIGTAQEITEQKLVQQQIMATLKEKEALLKEVHHRVKNNLQIVSSLLNLQSSQIKDATVLNIFTETKNRVRSMALLHETLYQTENLARLDFQQYVNSLCAHLRRAYGVDSDRIQLQTNITDVALDLEHAIPCGLMINELVSNALKHAFPDQRVGMIEIVMQRLPTHQYQLQVRDNGIGLPADLDHAHTTSLGIRLVYDLTLQLHGAVTVTQERGTTFTIVFA